MLGRIVGTGLILLVMHTPAFAADLVVKVRIVEFKESEGRVITSINPTFPKDVKVVAASATRAKPGRPFSVKTQVGGQIIEFNGKILKLERKMLAVSFRLNYSPGDNQSEVLETTVQLNVGEESVVGGLGSNGMQRVISVSLTKP